MAEWILKNCPANLPLSPFDRPQILDAGCGNGELLRLLSREGYDTTVGCDIEPGHVEAARRRTGLPIFQCDAARLCFEETWPFAPNIIVAIGWLHNDWPSLFATGIELRPENQNYLSDVLQAFGELLEDRQAMLRRYGLTSIQRSLLIFDKIPLDAPELKSNGFKWIETKLPLPDACFHIAEKVA